MGHLKYNVDIVMCIDCTESMGELLETVKANALRFYSDLCECFAEKGKDISELRIRTIAFRDFHADKSTAISDSGFFSIPEEEEEFHKFIGNLTPRGGGDEPENGLEAVAMAINSDWTTGGDRRRHIVVVWSDASTHPLELEMTKNEYYPADMPADFDEMTDWWEDEQGGKMDAFAKRIIIFAPDSSSWSDIGLNWSNAIHYTARACEGLRDIDYKTIMSSISWAI